MATWTQYQNNYPSPNNFNKLSIVPSFSAEEDICFKGIYYKCTSHKHDAHLGFRPDVSCLSAVIKHDVWAHSLEFITRELSTVRFSRNKTNIDMPIIEAIPTLKYVLKIVLRYIV